VVALGVWRRLADSRRAEGTPGGGAQQSYVEPVQTGGREVTTQCDPPTRWPRRGTRAPLLRLDSGGVATVPPPGLQTELRSFGRRTRPGSGRCGRRATGPARL